MKAGRLNGWSVGFTALAASLLCSYAQAAGPAEDPYIESTSRSIVITGLDLSTQAGAQRLYRDIARTAWSICLGTSRAHRGLARVREQKTQARRCFDEAVDGALAQVMAKSGVDLERVAGADRFDHAGLVAWR